MRNKIATALITTILFLVPIIPAQANMMIYSAAVIDDRPTKEDVKVLEDRVVLSELKYNILLQKSILESTKGTTEADEKVRAAATQELAKYESELAGYFKARQAAQDAAIAQAGESVLLSKAATEQLNGILTELVWFFFSLASLLFLLIISYLLIQNKISAKKNHSN